MIQTHNFLIFLNVQADHEDLRSLTTVHPKWRIMCKASERERHATTGLS